MCQLAGSTDWLTVSGAEKYSKYSKWTCATPPSVASELSDLWKATDVPGGVHQVAAQGHARETTPGSGISNCRSTSRVRSIRLGEPTVVRAPSRSGRRTPALDALRVVRHRPQVRSDSSTDWRNLSRHVAIRSCCLADRVGSRLTLEGDASFRPADN